MKRRFLAPLAFMITALFAAPAISNDADTKANGGEAVPEARKDTTYKVVPGDTLWGISGRFLENPFKWPLIWNINPNIKNPDLIYPGDIVRITPKGVEIIHRAEGVEKVPDLPIVPLEPQPHVVLEPEEAAPAAPAEAKKKVASHSFAREGFITDEEIRSIGQIIKVKEDKLLATEGDDVFLKIKENGAKEGDRYTVFVIGREITHPVTKKKLGHLIDILGSLVITKTGDVTEGKVGVSYKEIQAGSKLRAYREPVTEVEITGTEKAVEGYVVTALEGKENLSAGDVVYIDKGEADGIAKGNVMQVYRPRGTAQDPYDQKKKLSLPPEDLGRLVVVEPGQKTSVGVIIKSFKAIVRGDRVSTVSLN